MEYEGGEKYEGEVKQENVKHGYGIDIDTEGNKYQGNWSNGER